MTDQEIRIRQKINRMGYKLKFVNNKYFIKDYPNGLIFCNLEKVQEWIRQKSKEKKEEERHFREMVELFDEKTIFPAYTEECKKEFFKSIKENGINNDSKKILDKIFDKDSDLYNNPYVKINYDVEQILSNINENEYHSSQDLESMVFSDMEGYYFSEIKRLNPDVDPDIIHDLPSYDFTDFYYKVLEHISVDELEKYIMELADHD